MIALAQSATTVHEWAVNPTFWPTREDFVTWCQHMDPVTGAVLIVGGIFLMFSGFKAHRALIALSAAVIGAYIGAGLAFRYGFPVWLGIPAGAGTFGTLAYYFTAWAAGGLGAVCGALLGASLWMMFNLAPAYAWSGALSGALLIGLLCFIIFRISVIVFTSMQGAAMFVLGTLGLAYHYPFVRPTLDSILGGWPLALPVALLGLMLLGIIFQYVRGPGGGGGAKRSSGGESKSEPKPEKKEKAKG